MYTDFRIEPKFCITTLNTLSIQELGTNTNCICIYINFIFKTCNNDTSHCRFF